MLVVQSCLTLATPGACQAPLSKGFTRQEYWTGLPFPSPGDFPNLGIDPGSPALQADSLPMWCHDWTDRKEEEVLIVLSSGVAFRGLLIANVCGAWV